jgi:hypothetical protein
MTVDMVAQAQILDPEQWERCKEIDAREISRHGGQCLAQGTSPEGEEPTGTSRKTCRSTASAPVLRARLRRATSLRRMTGRRQAQLPTPLAGRDPSRRPNAPPERLNQEHGLESAMQIAGQTRPCVEVAAAVAAATSTAGLAVRASPRR